MGKKLSEVVTVILLGSSLLLISKVSSGGTTWIDSACTEANDSKRHQEWQYRQQAAIHWAPGTSSSSYGHSWAQYLHVCLKPPLKSSSLLSSFLQIFLSGLTLTIWSPESSGKEDSGKCDLVETAEWWQRGLDLTTESTPLCNFQ